MELDRDSILEALERIALSRPNDAVALALEPRGQDQKANCCPWKQAMAQHTKLSPMHRVFPLRTAPSQMMAS